MRNYWKGRLVISHIVALRSFNPLWRTIKIRKETEGVKEERAGLRGGWWW